MARLFPSLSAPLATLGYEYGNIVFNSPTNPKKDKKLGHEHFKFIKTDDLLVLTTRPPISDENHWDKKYLARSFTHLEDQVFLEFRKYLDVCARSHVQLTSAAGADYEGFRFCFLPTQQCAPEIFKATARTSQQKTPKDSEIAIGFFLCTPSIPVYGCGLLACFGMGGWETLIWNRIVRIRYPEWVSRPSFIIGQFDLKGLPHTSAQLGFRGQNQGGDFWSIIKLAVKNVPGLNPNGAEHQAGGVFSDANTFRPLLLVLALHAGNRAPRGPPNLGDDSFLFLFRDVFHQ